MAAYALPVGTSSSSPNAMPKMKSDMTCCVESGGAAVTSLPISRSPGNSASMLSDVSEVRRA